MSLANFDEIAAEGADRIIKPDGLDYSRSQMLSEILSKKIFRHQHPPGWRIGHSVGTDLEELFWKASDIHDEQRSVFREWADKGESTGYFALQRLQLVAWYLQTPDEGGPEGGDHVRSFFDANLTEARGNLRTLRSVFGPYGDLVSPEATTETLGKYEAGCRSDLEALQVQLAERIGGAFRPIRWWATLPQANRIAFGGTTAAIAAIVVSIVLR